MAAQPPESAGTGFDRSDSTGFARALRRLPGLGAAIVFLGLLTGTPSYGATCPSNIDADRCTANDLQPTGTQVVAGPDACTEGETISATIRVFFGDGGGANERYDLGFFVGENGEEPIGGSSCAFQSLEPTGPPPPLDLTSGSGPFEVLDGDSCGDLSASNVTYVDISSNNLLCEDRDGDGQIDVGYVISYSNQGNAADCSDPDDETQFYPDPPKCIADLNYDLPIRVELPPSIEVVKVAVPAVLVAQGTPISAEVTYYVAIQNTSSITDPVTITSLTDNPYGNLAGRGTCALPIKLAPGQSRQCSFTETVTGVAGDSITDTVTAGGTDNEGTPVSGVDSATVRIIGTPQREGNIELFKVALPRSLPEPGGIARYSVLATSTTEVPVTLETLVDDLYGDLDGRGSCSVPQYLRPDQPFYLCQFQALVNGDPGDVIVDTVTATGLDDNGNALLAEDQAAVTVTNRNAQIAVEKVPFPLQVIAPAGLVTFTVAVQNESAVDEVTITSLVDSVHGDLNGQGDCSVPQVLAPRGGSYLCQFDALVTGIVGDFETDVVTVSGTDDDGEAVSESDGATVYIVDAGGLTAGISISKLASPTAVTEPGEDVNFTLQIFNTSSVRDLTVDTLVDSVFGNLDRQGSCVLPILIPAGAGPHTCGFTGLVSGQGGDEEVNAVIASGDDGSGNRVRDKASARVAILDASPGLSLVKRAAPSFLPPPGGPVTFTVEVTNTSPSDSVELESLTDSVYGDLNGKGNCSLPQTLAPGASYSCQFQQSVVGEAVSLHVNEVLALGTSDDGDALSAQGRAFVLIAVTGGAVTLWGGGSLALIILALAALARRALPSR